MNPSPTALFSDIRAILDQARGKAYTAVNSAMVEAYWRIGQRIVEEEQGGQATAVHGSGLLKELSRSLTAEFGKGFSYPNLRNFRQFYLTYPDFENCYALRSNLSWTHHRLIMRVEDEAARNYYNLLKCFVIVDLKTDKLTHQDIGQIDMYVRMFDDLKRGPDDNPTIGLILCADKDETIVQYSVLKESEQIFASKYRTILPTEAELTAELERERRLIEAQQEGADD